MKYGAELIFDEYPLDEIREGIGNNSAIICCFEDPEEILKNEFQHKGIKLRTGSKEWDEKLAIAIADGKFHVQLFVGTQTPLVSEEIKN